MNQEKIGFEVITEPKEHKKADELAEELFMESIRMIGGLKRLIEFRNLTWLPSLAEAAYVVILRNEYMKSPQEIAKELGISENTVRNILRADESEIEELLEGKIEKTDEHKAGGLAKMAYKRLKKRTST